MTEQPGATTPSVEDEQANAAATQGEQTAGTTEQAAQPQAGQQTQPQDVGQQAQPQAAQVTQAEQPQGGQQPA